MSDKSVRLHLRTMRHRISFLKGALKALFTGKVVVRFEERSPVESQEEDKPYYSSSAYMESNTTRRPLTEKERVSLARSFLHMDSAFAELFGKDSKIPDRNDHRNT